MTDSSVPAQRVNELDDGFAHILTEIAHREAGGRPRVVALTTDELRQITSLREREQRGVKDEQLELGARQIFGVLTFHYPETFHAVFEGEYDMWLEAMRDALSVLASDQPADAGDGGLPSSMGNPASEKVERGTFACPICGQETPHAHSDIAVNAYHSKGAR